MIGESHFNESAEQPHPFIILFLLLHGEPGAGCNCVIQKRGEKVQDYFSLFFTVAFVFLSHKRKRLRTRRGKGTNPRRRRYVKRYVNIPQCCLSVQEHKL